MMPHEPIEILVLPSPIPCRIISHFVWLHFRFGLSYREGRHSGSRDPKHSVNPISRLRNSTRHLDQGRDRPRQVIGVVIWRDLGAVTQPTLPSHSLSYRRLGHSPLLRAPRTSDPAPADGAAFAVPVAVISLSETPIASTSKLSSAPSLGLLVTEPLRGALEYGRMHLMNRDHLPTGDGHAVVLFPGLGTDRRFMSPLKDHCQQLGYVCYDWTRGFNFGPEGDVEYWLTELAAEVRDLIRGHQQSVSLIGWSLGGIYAREIAKVLTKRIRQVITLGSPFAGIDATRATWLYRLVNGSGVPARKAFAQALKSPPPVPTSSIYSRSDGVVAWRSCREVSGPRAENIEVVSSHLGLVCHPTVFTVIADRLAQRPGQWSPWRDSVNLEPHVTAA